MLSMEAIPLQEKSKLTFGATDAMAMQRKQTQVPELAGKPVTDLVQSQLLQEVRSSLQQLNPDYPVFGDQIASRTSNIMT